MLDFITLAVQPFVKIRKEEWSKTLLMFFYFFITITCLYILKPVRSSIFLEKSGFENLPYVWISTVLILMGVVAVYVKIVGMVQKNVLLIGTVTFFISNILIFWWLLGKDIYGLPSAFYIWVSIFSIMNVTQFWTLANDTFNPREAKRLFGFIGSGGILGGMCGGYITGLLVHSIGTVNLLIVAALILCFSVVVIQIIWKKEHSHSGTKLHQDEDFEASASKEDVKKQNRDIFKNIWRSKYLLLLLTMVCLAKLVSTLVEYQFNGVVQEAFSGIDKKTAFFGWFWGMLNSVSFVIMFFLTSRVLRHLGVKVALLILPVGLLFGNMAILLNPGLWSAVFTMMYDGSLNYSLNQASKEVLYLPLAREIRYRVKPFIDMVGYRTAKGIGSLLILFMTHVLIFNLKAFCVFTIAIIVVWIMAAFVMKKEYLAELKSILIRERGEIPHISIQSSDTQLLEMVVDTFSAGSRANQLCAMRALNLAHNGELVSMMKSFGQNSVESAREEIQNHFDKGVTEADGDMKQIISRNGIGDFQEWVRFISSYRGPEEISGIRIFLANQSAAVQKAAFFLLVLFDKEFDYLKLPENFRLNLKFDAVINRKVILDGSDLSEKKIHIRRKLSAYLESGDSEKALGLIEDFLRDEEDFMTVLDQLLNRERLPDFAILKLIRVLSMIPRQKSIDILQTAVMSSDGDKRNAIVEALSKIRVENPTLEFNEKVILREINAEVREYGKALRLLSICLWSQGKTFNESFDTGDSFVVAQESRLSEIVQRIFLFLLLMSEPEDIRAAYAGFSHASDYVRSNALELLDNLLTSKLRHPVLSLLDGDDSLPRIRVKGIKDFHWNKERASAYLKKTIQSDDLWSSVSSAVLIARCQLKDVFAECISIENFSNPLTRDTLILMQTLV